MLLQQSVILFWIKNSPFMRKSGSNISIKNKYNYNNGLTFTTFLIILLGQKNNCQLESKQSHWRLIFCLYVFLVVRIYTYIYVYMFNYDVLFLLLFLCSKWLTVLIVTESVMIRFLYWSSSKKFMKHTKHWVTNGLDARLKYSKIW